MRIFKAITCFLYNNFFDQKVGRALDYLHSMVVSCFIVLWCVSHVFLSRFLFIRRWACKASSSFTAVRAISWWKRKPRCITLALSSSASCLESPRAPLVKQASRPDQTFYNFGASKFAMWCSCLTSPKSVDRRISWRLGTSCDWYQNCKWARRVSYTKSPIPWSWGSKNAKGTVGLVDRILDVCTPFWYMNMAESIFAYFRPCLRRRDEISTRTLFCFLFSPIFLYRKIH